MSSKRKRGRVSGIILTLLAAAAVFLLIVCMLQKMAVYEDGAFILSFGKKDIRDYLTEYTDSDTRFIYADDDPGHVLMEMQEALENRERQVCVIGDHADLAEGYSNGTSDQYYDNGVFRKLPYSTFWLRNYETVGGHLTVEKLSGEVVDGDRWSVYTFDYYPIGDDEVREMKADIDREADEILSLIPDEADLWQKCRIIHDELIRRISYDNTFEDHCHDLYGALANHRAVCEGYALAFDHILNLAGGSGDVVVSDWDEDPDTAMHAWNRIGAQTGEKYIDVTWDDPEYTDPAGDAIILYDYFGLTEEEIAAVDSYHFAGYPEEYAEENVIFNYYRHEGYLLTGFDLQEVSDLFLRQYGSGANVLTVRFDQEQAYQEALDTLTDTDRMNEVLGYLGFYGSYWRMTNDDLYILTIGLGELPETG